MAITRGQMQRQLRRGGGIMNIAPRERFGIGSSLKKFVRKVIPNEVSKVATFAAPFVAPFNPAVAAAMAGIGSFDQTGSLSGALKSGALTYGGGQLARFAGGAGFQGNPFTSGGAFTPSGFTAGFSSPIGTQTGIGKLFKKSPEIEAISGSDFGQFKETPFGAGDALGGEMLTTGAPEIVKEGATQTITKAATESAPKSVIQAIKNQDYFEAAKLAAEKGTKALFLDKDGNLDKTMVLAAGTAGLTYLDAKKLADELGEDIGTEEEYDEATKAEKKAEYAGYLTNFFEGKKDGGRIGFDEGANKKFAMIKDMLAKGMDEETIMSIAEATQADIDSVKNKRVEEAQGGRIGFRFGDKVEDEEGILAVMDKDKDDEDMDDLMAGTGINFSRQEKSYLFRRLGGAGGADRSYTMPNLYRILSNPSRYPEDARVLKQIAIMGLSGKKDGGRIGAKDGFSFMELIDDEAYDKKLKVKEDLINELMEKGYRFEDIMQLVSPRTKRLMDDGTYKEYGDAPSISLGKIGLAMGGEVPVRTNKAGIEELDYRQTGGFVPVGVKEKADDVPAMLSKNEFVLTADAVRGIGGGDVEKGAEKLYGVMKQAEKVGRA